MKKNEKYISNILRRDDAKVLNKKFGKLTAIKYAYSKNQQRYFECHCDCGNIVNVAKGLLLFGSVKSCGCSKSYKNIKDAITKNTTSNGACIIWTGTIAQGGYGKINFRGKVYTAHRLLWEMENGPIPPGHIVSHTCNNRACVEIKHLFLTTPKSCSEKMKKEGRAARGSKNGSAKLNEKKVIEIRKILREHPEIPISKIAEKFNVHHTTVRRIQNRKAWPHVGPGNSVVQKSDASSTYPSSIGIPKKKMNKRRRVEALNRDGHTCVKCGASPQKDSAVQLHVDHIIPRSQGGKDALDNLQTLCSSCNLGKGAELL